MEILEGIHQVDDVSGNMARSNVYLIVNPNNLMIVDTGTPGNAKKNHCLHPKTWPPTQRGLKYPLNPLPHGPRR